ncbi:meiotically up-regulated gene 113-domain-containing protein [Clohesyomyces aquaticus]|uniref:Meiotically up-regulated gene 113-domain-containing protein n=1 Tax=Clohesyomyces aquaticus TaxID=1231657 RepID=A0A1Y1ZR24_9PLEO|nr:meiotically up-regulated gene 113-domain-containing protein [Clohesyomyces aquaticus]
MQSSMGGLSGPKELHVLGRVSPEGLTTTQLGCIDMHDISIHAPASLPTPSEPVLDQSLPSSCTMPTSVYLENATSKTTSVLTPPQTPTPANSLRTGCTREVSATSSTSDYFTGNTFTRRSNQSYDTPLTPPDTEARENGEVETQVSPLARKSAGRTISKSSVDIDEHIKQEEMASDNAPAQKLFRGMTATFEGVLNGELDFKLDLGRHNTFNPHLDFDYAVFESTGTKPTGAHADQVTKLATKVATKGSKPKAKGKEFRKILDEIVPRNLHQRISTETGKCAASVGGCLEKRCTRRAKRTENVAQDLVVLAESYDRHDCESFLANLKELIKSMCCGTHYNSATHENRYGALEKLIQQAKPSLAQDDSLLPVNPSIKIEWETFVRWADMVCERNDADGEDVARDEPRLRRRSTNIARSTLNPVSRPVGGRLSWLNDLRFWQPKWSASLSTQNALEKTARKTLTPTELKSGYIYIFWTRGQFGIAKIGYTKDVNLRLKGWTKQCGQQYQFYKSSTVGECLRICLPHVSRVEKLIHTELKDYRMKMRCKGCGKEHREWFEVQEQHAVKVFTKWRDWIQQRPYQNLEGVWKLHAVCKDDLEGVCQPLPIEQLAKPTPQPKRNVKGLLGRKRQSSFKLKGSSPEWEFIKRDEEVVLV